MEVSNNLLTLFSGKIERQGGSYIVEIPERELDVGELREGVVYRMAVSQMDTETPENQKKAPQQPSQSESPPVEEGDVLDVEIEDIGDQGDGITRVGPGYVVIVSDTKVGDRITIEITEARENVAFAEVTERKERSR